MRPPSALRDEGYLPGDLVPVSGVYDVYDPRYCVIGRAAYLEGQLFPRLVRDCTFVLVETVASLHYRASHSAA